MVRTRFARRSLLIVIAALAPAAAGAQWNLANDYSQTTNPLGVWSYGSRATANSTALSLYGTISSSYGWDFSWSSPGLPSISKNISAVAQSVSTLPYIGAGVVTAHPGAAGELSIARFTAPSAGMYAFTSLFTGLDCCTTNTDVHVVHDGVSLFSGLVQGLFATQGYNASMYLDAGDYLDFAVGANGVYFYDTTQIDVDIDAITATPEPASIVLLATGLVGVAGFARRRRSRA